jgi:hypothetical protein
MRQCFEVVTLLSSADSVPNPTITDAGVLGVNLTNQKTLQQKMAHLFCGTSFLKKNIIFLEEQSTKVPHQNTNQFRSLSSNQLLQG